MTNIETSHNILQETITLKPIMLNDFQAYFDSKGIIYFTDLDGFPGNKHTKRKYVKKWTTICLKTMESVVNNTRKKFQQHEAKKD